MSPKYQLGDFDKAIIASLAYAQIKEWPLTAWEIFQYLINPQRISENPLTKKGEPVRLQLIYEHLGKLEEQGIVFEKDGFYALRGLSKNRAIRRRIQRDKMADKKIKKAKQIVSYLKYFPFIRGVFLSGSLVFGWVRQESDIDVLIITASNHLWTVRFFLSGLLLVLGLKRSKGHIENRLCLNHFITTKTLKIPLYSLYNAQTYSRLVPLFASDRLIREFFKRNDWLEDYLLLSRKILPQQDLRIKRFKYYDRTIQCFFEIMLIFFGAGRLLEQFLRKIQIYCIKKNPLTYRQGGRVAVNETQIEFHPNSPEKKVLKKYNKILSELNLFYFKPEKDSGLS